MIAPLAVMTDRMSSIILRHYTTASVFRFYVTSTSVMMALLSSFMCVLSYYNIWDLHQSHPGSRHRHHTSSAVVYSDLCDTGSYWPHMYGGPLGTERKRD